MALLKSFVYRSLGDADFSLESLPTPEAVEIVSQTEQESLFALGGERTARCFGGELAFDCAEDRLGMHALPIALGRESRAHLRAHAMNLPARLASFSGNDTLRANPFADVPVVAFAVELGIGQNRSNGVAWTTSSSKGGKVAQSLIGPW